MNDKPLNIKIPEKLYNGLKSAAEDKCLSLAGLVRMISSEWLAQNSAPLEVDANDVFDDLPGALIRKENR